MKIAITADPEIPVPPLLYGGIERIIAMLIDELVAKGHEVTLFAHPDSQVPCKLIPYPGRGSRRWHDVISNTWIVSQALFSGFDVVHSFGRLAYLTALLPSTLPKIMSYQREPSLQQVKRAMQLARRGTMCFTGCSEYIASQIRPLAPAYAIYNGVPLNKYDYVAQVPAEAPLAFLGRIEPIKGAHLAVEIARKSGRTLVLAGNVPPESQDYFNATIRPYLDGEQITYIGPVNDAQKNELLGQASAMLMPIEWNEPFGIVMAEALACGTPVIAFARGAAPEVVQHGVNGYLCTTLEEMLALIPAIASLQRSECRRTVEQHFSSQAIGAQYEALYRKIRN